MKNKLFIFLPIIFIIIISYFLFYSFYIVESVETLKMDIIISNHYGFNLDTDLLHLGRTVPGGVAFHGFKIRNNADHPIKVNIIKKGVLGAWVNLNETEFIMQPQAERTIMVTAYPPQDANFGNYTGELRIPVRKVWG